MTDLMLPVPADALQTSINYFDTGDRDAARYWLDVARELRQGHAPAPTTVMNEPVPAADSDSTMRIIPGYSANDATAVIASISDNRCPSCNGETFLNSVDGRAIHRATYRPECEFASAPLSAALT
ncbi:MAG: hypothetical protein ABWY81_10940 [Jiangellaceae bacterium]